MAETISHKEHAMRHSHASNHLKMLDTFRKKRVLPKELEPDALDSLLWRNQPLEIVRGGKFPELINFEGFNETMRTNVDVIVSRDDSTKNKRLPSKGYEFRLTREPNLKCTLLLGGSYNNGQNGLVEVCNDSVVGASKSASGLRMAVGVDNGLLGSMGGTLVNMAQRSTINMRVPALRAMLLLRQLTILHDSADGVYSLRARKLTHQAAPARAGAALGKIVDHDVVLDVHSMSKVQLELLTVITSEWPSQQLVSNNDNTLDIYSGLTLREDKTFFYVGQGPPRTWSVQGVSLAPEDCWYEIVQLFRTLGGLADLIEVFSETRGLAPMMMHCCRELGASTHVGIPYARTRCYGNLVNRPITQAHIRCTELEASAMTLLVDQIMLSAALANIHFLCEALGFLSAEVVPVGSGISADRMNDIFNCYGMRSRMSSSSCNDYVTPWLVRLSRYGRLCAALVSKNVVMIREGNVPELCGYYCHISGSNRITASSCQRLRDKITISGVTGGLLAKKERQGDLLRLLNWARLTGCLVGVPISGPSILGARMGSEVDQVYSTFCDWDGVFRATGYVVSVSYKPITSKECHLPDTFFYKSEFIQAVLGEQSEGSVQNPRVNSYSIVGNGNNIQGRECGDARAENAPSTSGDSDSREHSGLVTPQGSGGVSQELVMIPNATCEYVDYTPGNCGIDALGHLIPGLNKEDGLQILGCSENDRFYLQGDELACIAANYGYDLILHHDNGIVDMYGDGSRNAVNVYQTGYHFVPMAVQPGNRNVMVLKMSAARTPTDDAERAACRKRIQEAQPNGRELRTGVLTEAGVHPRPGGSNTSGSTRSNSR